MGEANNNWQTKVENSDSLAGKNTKEQTAIDFLSKNQGKLPPDRFAKLVDQTIEIIKRKDIQIQQIHAECENALTELKKDRSLWENIQNVTVETTINKVTRNVNELLFDTNKKAEEEVNKRLWFAPSNDLNVRGFSDKWVHCYSQEEWNTFKTIWDFEKNIKNSPVKGINSRGLANYFLYLHSKGQLTTEVLVQQFWTDKLLELGMLWKNGGNKNEMNSLIARTTLEAKGMGYIITTITALSSQGNILKQISTLHSPEEQKATISLLRDKHGSLQKKLQEDLKKNLMTKHPTMEVAEADKIVAELLIKLLKHEGLQWLPEVYKILNEHSNKHHVDIDKKKMVGRLQNIQRAKSELTQAEIRMAISNETDKNKKKILEKNLKTEAQKESGIKTAIDFNDQIDTNSINELITWNKTISQVTRQLKEKGSEKQEAKNAKEQKEDGATQEKQTYTAKEGPPKFSMRNIGSLPLDKPALYSLSPQDKAIITPRGGDTYELCVCDHKKTAVLTKDELKGYLQSFRFLEKLGLWYFVQTIAPEKLSDILKLSSTNTVHYNNEDGRCDSYEKRNIVSCFWKLLDIEWVDNIHPKDAPKVFQDNFKNHASLETILSNKWIITGGGIKIGALKDALKSA